MRAPIHFHPQRLYPTYAGPAELASRLPGGLSLASRLGGRVLFNQESATSEILALEELREGAFVVCAFPRSGSTYLQAAVEERTGDGPVLKSHDVLAISSYQGAGAHVLTPVRDPDTNAASWSLYNNDEPSLGLLRARLSTYTAWHRELARQGGRESLTLLDFSALTQNTDAALNRAGVGAQLVYAAGETTGALLNTYADQGRIDAHQAHLPSAHKKQASRHYLGLLEHPSIYRARKRAWASYRALEPYLSR